MFDLERDEVPLVGDVNNSNVDFLKRQLRAFQRPCGYSRSRRLFLAVLDRFIVGLTALLSAAAATRKEKAYGIEESEYHSQRSWGI